MKRSASTAGGAICDPQRIETVFAQHAREHGITLPPTQDPRVDAEWIRAASELPPRT